MADKISAERLEKELNGELSVTLSGRDGQPIEISPVIVFEFDDDMSNPRFNIKGYCVTVGEKKAEVGDFGKLLAELKELGLDENEYVLENFSNGAKSLKELDEMRAFENISMRDLLNKYAHADIFTLTAHYMQGIDREHPFGTAGVSGENAAHALQKIEEWAHKIARRAYGQALAEDDSLPPFDEMYAQIKEECRKFRSANAKKVRRRQGNAFFCDEFAHGKTRYTKPQQLWHIYHDIDFTQLCAYTLNELKKLPVPDEDPNDLPPALRGALIDTEYTFCWHCSASSLLSKVYSFRLNEDTREWLLGHENDYELNGGLEDLALYRGERILFSSCTHERFHVDCENIQGE